MGGRPCSGTCSPCAMLGRSWCLLPRTGPTPGVESYLNMDRGILSSTSTALGWDSPRNSASGISFGSMGAAEAESKCRHDSGHSLLQRKEEEIEAGLDYETLKGAGAVSKEGCGCCYHCTQR